MKAIDRICLLGFGEVGSILGEALGECLDRNLTAYDLQFDHPESKPAVAAYGQPHIEMADSATAAVKDCDLIVSAVTAAQNFPAAQSVLAGMQSGAWFLDLNSVAPTSKIKVAKTVEAAGGRYIEAAVMSPIEPKRNAAPILIGGPHARAFLRIGINLGFTGMRFCSPRLGQASATKMCRSVMIKGIEALLTESLLAARHYGVEDEVLVSLNDLFPRPDWPEHAHYMMSRSIEHGVRRADEMREAAITVSDAAIEPHMSGACAKRQDWAAQFTTALGQEELASMLDAILENQQGRLA